MASNRHNPTVEARQRTRWRPWWWAAAHGSTRVLVAVGALILLASAGVGAILNSGLSALDRGRRPAPAPPPTALAPQQIQPLVIPSARPARPPAPHPVQEATPASHPRSAGVVASAIAPPPVARGTVTAGQVATVARALPAATVLPAAALAPSSGPPPVLNPVAVPAAVRSPIAVSSAMGREIRPARAQPALALSPAAQHPRAHPKATTRDHGHHKGQHGHPAHHPARHAGR